MLIVEGNILFTMYLYFIMSAHNVLDLIINPYFVLATVILKDIEGSIAGIFSVTFY